MTEEQARAWAEKNNVAVTQGGWGKLRTLITLWKRYGKAMNLTGKLSDGALWSQVVDGLATVGVGDQIGVDGCWLDVGSGGGFPGLVLAAVRDWPLVLWEARQKRVGFLRLASGALRRPDVVMIEARFERATWNEKLVDGGWESSMPKVAVASARAVWGPSHWLELGKEIVGAGGAVVLHSDDVGKGAMGMSEVASVAGARGMVRGFRVN